MSEFPKEWEQIELSKLCLKITSGGTPKKEDGMYGGSVNWFRTNELQNDTLALCSHSNFCHK